MKILLKSAMNVFLLMLLTALATNLLAQDVEKAVVERLPAKAGKKIAKADKLLAKGNSILDKARQYDDEVTRMKESKGKLKTRKLNKLVSKSDDKKINAASYLKDGYAKKVKVYMSVLKDAAKADPRFASDIKEAENRSKESIKKAKVLYRRAGNATSKRKSVEFIGPAHENYQNAIDILLNELAGVYGIQKKVVAKGKAGQKGEQPVTVNAVNADTAKAEIKSIEEQKASAGKERSRAAVEQTVTEAVAVVPVTAVTGTEAEELRKEINPDQKDKEQQVSGDVTEKAKEEAVESLPVQAQESQSAGTGSGVFFTIQFLADKSKASPETIKSNYSGNLEVIEMAADGWYRYSAGKFTDLEEAKKVMKTEGIKGFIVAYKNNERITISEAIRLLK